MVRLYQDKKIESGKTIVAELAVAQLGTTIRGYLVDPENGERLPYGSVFEISDEGMEVFENICNGEKVIVPFEMDKKRRIKINK